MNASLAPALVILGKVTLGLAAGLGAATLARRGRAAVRHLVLAMTFVLALALPAASWLVPAIDIAILTPAPLPGPSSEIVVNEPTPAASPEAGTTPGLSRRENGTRVTMSAATWLAVAWLAGAALLLLPVSIGLRQMRSFRRTGLPWARGQRIVDSVAAESGLRQRIDLLLHASIPGPLTFGVVRPAIMLPSDATAWSDEDLGRAIVHELEHIRRGDWMSQCLARVVRAAYWFHPLVWIIWRRFVIEAERACDDAVLRRSEATAYADQLVGLATRLSAGTRQPLLAMANRRDLSTRVRAVLSHDQPRGRAGGLAIGVTVAASIAMILIVSPLRIVAAAPQSQGSTPAGTKVKPRYDVASIKPCVAEEVPTGARGAAGGTNASISPGRFQVPCVTAEQLIYLAYAAYGARDDQHLVNDDMGSASDAQKIRGGPDWVHSLKDKYAVEATAAGATERVVLMGDMLQSLLEDRFKLKVHRETEQVDMLELKVGKAGVKLTPMKDGDCEENPADGSRPDPNAAKPRCGSINMAGSTSQVRWTFGGFAMSTLATMLTRDMKVHVIDSTGVSDKFVFRFEFQRDEPAPTSGGQLDPRGRVSEAGQPALSLNAALDAIGLKLEKTRAPRGYLVIDRIERPTPNDPAAEALPPARAAGAGARRR